MGDMKEVHLVECCEHKKDPVAIFATMDEVFAIEEMHRLMGARTKICFYRVTACPVRERE